MTGETQTIDVRWMVPRDRHPLIFDTFAKLAAGDSFLLVNDHDPRPLYHQLAAEHGGALEWDYVECGPETWKVRIARRGGCCGCSCQGAG